VSYYSTSAGYDFFDMTNEFGKRKKDVSKYRRPTGTNLTPRLSRVIRFIEDVVSCGTVPLMVFIVIIICYHVVTKNIRSLTTVPQLGRDGLYLYFFLSR
jgi:hypothetical protein